VFVTGWYVQFVKIVGKSVREICMSGMYDNINIAFEKLAGVSHEIMTDQKMSLVIPR
jgi:hypothetical protein